VEEHYFYRGEVMSEFSHDIFGSPISLEDLNVAFRCHDLDRVRPHRDPLRSFPIEEVCCDGDGDVEAVIIDRIDNGDWDADEDDLPSIGDDFVIEEPEDESEVRVCGMALSDYLDLEEINSPTGGIPIIGLSASQKAELVDENDFDPRAVRRVRDRRDARPKWGCGFKPVDRRQLGAEGIFIF
jgi:hypothetical protein